MSKMYAVKNDEGSWLSNEGGVMRWDDTPSTFYEW